MENVSIQEPKIEEENKEKDINYKRVYIRLSVVLVGIIIIFCLNNFYKGDFNSLKPNQCYNDLGHNWTSSVNEYFRKNIAARNAMLIFTGLLVVSTLGIVERWKVIVRLLSLLAVMKIFMLLLPRTL